MSAPSVNLPLSSNTFVPDSSRTPISGYDTTTSYEQSRRQVSSVVVSEQFLGNLPESGGIKYVEVPVIEEVVKHVPRREIVEVEKIVPKYEYEYVERVVEVPQVHYVDKHVEVPQIHEVVRHVPKVEYQEVPREIIKHVPKIETVTVEKIVNVPGQVIEVPKPYVVENKVPVKRFQDKNMAVVVAQTIRPVVTESNEVIDVDVYEYEPQVIPVDVHVAKPVASHLVAVGATQEIHHIVNVPSAQYNSILRSINSHLGADVDSLPYIKEGHHIPFLAGHEMPGTVTPVAGVEIHTTRTGETEMHLSNIIQRDGGMTTSSSIYQGGQYHNGSVAMTGHEQMIDTASNAQLTAVPPVYPNIMTREVVDSVAAPSVVKTQSHYHQKSHKSGRSFVASQPVHRKRNGCQC